MLKPEWFHLSSALGLLPHNTVHLIGGPVGAIALLNIRLYGLVIVPAFKYLSTLTDGMFGIK